MKKEKFRVLRKLVEATIWFVIMTFIYIYIQEKNRCYASIAEVWHVLNSETTYVVCVTSGYAKQRFTFKPTLETHAIHYQFTNTPNKTRAISPSTTKKKIC